LTRSRFPSGGRDGLDLIHLQETVLQDRLRAKVVPAVHDVELVGETGQEKAFLESRVAPSDDSQVRPFEEGAVADRAVRDPAAVVLLLADDAELGRLSTDGDDDGVCGELGAVLELHDLPVALAPDLLHGLVCLDLETEFESVFRHLLRELRSGDRLKAGVVLDELGVEDLAADVF